MEIGIIVIALGIYLFLLILISLLSSKNSTQEDFLIAGRNRSYTSLISSKFANSVGASWLLVITAYAYEFGLSTIVIAFGGIIGNVLFALWAVPKIYENSKKKKFYTMGDFVFHKLKKRSSLYFTNGVAILYQLLFLIVSIIGGAKLIEYFNIFSYEFSVVIITVFVLIYILIAGYKAVIITDIIQGIIIFLFLIILFSGFFMNNTTSEFSQIETKSLGTATFIGILLYSILGVFSSPDRFLLSYAAKDLKSIKRSFLLMSIPIFIVIVLLILIGVLIYSLNPLLDPSLVFLEAISTYLPESLLLISIILFFAALMSSTDTGMFIITSHIIMTFKKNNPTQLIKVSSIVLSILLIITAYYIRDVITVTIIASATSMALIIPVMYVLFEGKSSLHFNLSMSLGLIGVLIGILFAGIDPSISLFVLFGGLGGLLIATIINTIKNNYFHT